MSSRNKTDVKKLFEYWCEVARTHGGIEHTNSLRQNGGYNHSGTPVGVITESFPESFRDEKTIQDIPAFAFPCEFERDSVQSYSFVLTTDDSKWRFGFCRYDPKTDSTMVVITLLPWHDTFLRLLTVLVELRRTDRKEFQQFLTEAYSGGVPDMGSQLKLVYSQGQSQFVFERPKPFQLPSIPENHNLNLYYNFVHPKTMIAVFAAMLAERRIIFTSRRLDRLSSCIQAANAFLYPMVWQHIFIPVLPMKLKDYLSAPMPYLIGVPHAVLETMCPEELGEVVTLNCDNSIFESPFDDVHEMPTEIVSQLKKQLSQSNQHMGDRVSKIFLGVLVQLIGGYRDAVEFRDAGKTFNRDRFIESRPSHLRPFLAKMMELQIFQQFIDERLEMMNTGLGFSDEFEQETVRYAEKLKKRGRFSQLKEKTNPAVKSAVQSVKQSSRVAKHAYKDLKSKLRDITPPHPSPHQHLQTNNNNNFRSHLAGNPAGDRLDGKDGKGLKSYMGRHSAPSSPVFNKRIGTSSAAVFQYASKDQIANAPHLRRGPTPLAMSSSSTHIQSNGYAKSSPLSFNHSSHLGASPTISPASSLCSSEMNLSQELQNHPLFKSPIVDRSLKPCHSLESHQRISAARVGAPPPARPPPPAPHLLQLYQQQHADQPSSMRQSNAKDQRPPLAKQQLTSPTYYNHPYGANNRSVEAPTHLPYVPRSASSNNTAQPHPSPLISTMTSHTLTTTSTATSVPSSSSQLPALNSIPSHRLIQTTDSSYDTPPDMLSPPVPPRRQPQMGIAAGASRSLTLPHSLTLTSHSAAASCNGTSNANALSQAVAATAAAVTAGINRLERNCWQDYATTELLQNDSLRSSSSSSTSQQSHTSSASSASSSSGSFVTAASRFSLYQSSPPAVGCEPPVPAPRLKKDKDKESLRSLQPQHMTMTMGGLNGGCLPHKHTNNNAHSDGNAAPKTTNASEESMKDLISLDDSHNSSFDLEDFDPLNQNARPLPASLNSHRKKSTTLPTKPSSGAFMSNANSSTTTTSSISNPLYTFYTPQHLASKQPATTTTPPSEKPPPLPKSVPPPMPPPDEDFELLRKYGLDQFTLITTSVTATSNNSASTTLAQPPPVQQKPHIQNNGLLTSTGMQNWTTFD